MLGRKGRGGGKEKKARWGVCIVVIMSGLPQSPIHTKFIIFFCCDFFSSILSGKWNQGRGRAVWVFWEIAAGTPAESSHLRYQSLSFTTRQRTRFLIKTNSFRNSLSLFLTLQRKWSVCNYFDRHTYHKEANFKINQLLRKLTTTEISSTIRWHGQLGKQ